MIEAEWWDYDSLDEMADAVAGDIGFIIESALDARGEALIAVPGGKTRCRSSRSWPRPSSTGRRSRSSRPTSGWCR
jgi:hypothetical protein